MYRHTLPNSRTVLIVAIALLLVVLSGCSTVHSRRFLLEDREKRLAVAGWEIRPHIFCYEDMIHVDTLWDLYHVKLYLERERPEDFDTSGQTTFVEIDTVKVVMNAPYTDRTLPLRGAYWVSNVSHPDARRNLVFGESMVEIPLDAEGVRLEFMAYVRPGRHFLTIRYESVPYDTVAVDTNAECIDSVFFSVPIIRVDDQYKVPFFIGG